MNIEHKRMSATPASMLHIVSSGLQDRERLNAPIGQPSIHYYTSVLNRRTRWASQWRRVEFDNLADFGRTAICTLPINGELITRATLVLQLPDIYTPQITAINAHNLANPTKPLVGPSWAWTNGVGHAICSDVHFLIGDQIIDHMDSHIMELIDEFEGPVEHFGSKNLLIARDPVSYSDQQMIQILKNGQDITVPQTNPQTLEITFPFWWNKGPGPHALPIQALWKDKVQLRVTFRAMQDLVYTSTRNNPANPSLSPSQGTTGPLPTIADCGFFYADISSNTLIYDGASSENLTALNLLNPRYPLDPTSDDLIPANPFRGGVTRVNVMPSEYHFTDAYWIVEYVSLEDREASAFRMADLEIPYTQHEPLPIVETGGAADIRIRMEQAGLVRDLMWVAQREAALSYNAYFLFSRDLSDKTNASDIPWWPNAVLPDWDFGDGYIVPAFANRNSDPIRHAKMSIKGLTRFEHESPSMFRALIPAMNCRRCPLVDRYIYRYDFGFWPTGGIAETNMMDMDIRGCANWDKLPKREMSLIMDQPECANFVWEEDTTQAQIDLSGGQFKVLENPTISSFVPLFSKTTQGIRVILRGSQPRNADGTLDVSGNNGNGAIVDGVVDLETLRRRNGYTRIAARLVTNGSSALVFQDKSVPGNASRYNWIAVAGGGGFGRIDSGGGGNAGTAVDIGWQGGNAAQTHAYSGTSGTGTTVYNSVGPTNIVTQFDISFNSPTYTMLYDGSFNSVQMMFSINTSTAAQPFKITMIRNGVDTFKLTVPKSTKYVPLKTYSLVNSVKVLNIPVMIDVSANDTLQFVLEASYPPPAITGPAFNKFYARTDATAPYELACKVIINTLGTSPTYQTVYGGGGGGRLTQAGIGQSGIDASGNYTPIATTMSTAGSFVTNVNTWTGSKALQYFGGDGYQGGGSGEFCGGGGGSFVSGFISEVSSYINYSVDSDVGITIIPLKRVPTQQPNFNILSWVTRYKRLRINSGHGVMMFNDVV